MQLPQGVRYIKTKFTAKSDIYRDRLNASRNHQPNQASAELMLTVTYQGCADC
ncbi:protein-disulfide reductase DsbD domain-containing protein [Escherichia coli]